MAYFANGSEGAVFDCKGCKYKDKPCLIALIQMEHNYSACNNKEATAILDKLVKNDGTCMMQKFMATHNPKFDSSASLAAFLTEELVKRTTKMTGKPVDICERADMKDYIDASIDEFYEG